jgi:DNA-binding response OmpR family regulator
MKKPRLFIIDDEAPLIDFIADIAIKNNYDVKKYTDANLFRKKFSNDADVIMLDLIMPDVDGIEIIQYLAEMQCKAQIILMSGFVSEMLEMAQVLATGHKLNIATVLNKPLRFKELNELLEKTAKMLNSQV